MTEQPDKRLAILRIELLDLGYYGGPVEASPWRAAMAALGGIHRDGGACPAGESAGTPDSRHADYLLVPLERRMTKTIDGVIAAQVYATTDGLFAIEQARDVVIRLSSDQILPVIDALRAYYEARATWQETALR